MHQREAHEEHQVATGGSVWSAPQLRLLRREPPWLRNLL